MGNKMEEKNSTYFGDNAWYQDKVLTLDTYVYCRMCIESELKGCKSLLDIGNGGFFNYDIASLERVVILDLCIDETADYGKNVTPIRGDALKFDLEEKFDAIVIQMLIHHVTGTSPEEAVKNMELILEHCANHLTPAGKILLIESTVPSWFHFFEKIVFRLLYKFWNFPHPITFQHTASQILRSARKAGLKIEEYVHIPLGQWVVILGFLVPTKLTPVQPIKVVLSNPSSTKY
ncbi:class I SAM-dependent methyltransferase [Phormidium tenue FACHB-886]|nr:class I SAM-dependent methyltransferase [Phormidium tenue FACHB-886]